MMKPFRRGAQAVAATIQASGPLRMLALAGAINLTLGYSLMLLQPHRAMDLWLLHDWAAGWLSGQPLYDDLQNVTDYPPNAIVMLSPLALIPRGWVVPVWATFTGCLTLIFPFVVLRATTRRVDSPMAVAAMLSFLCWGGARMLLQFSRLALTLAFAAVLLAEAAPLAAGVCLGLALAKPQIAGPVALWMLLTGRTRSVAIAGVTVAAGFAVFCIHAHANPLLVVSDYLRTLTVVYADPSVLVGRTSIRRWTFLWTSTPLGANIAWMVGSVALLVAPCVAALSDRRRAPPPGAPVALALFCLWSLLVWYHLSNNFVLMLPAVALLLVCEDERSRTSRLAMAAVMEVAAIADVPLRLARLAPALGPAGFLIVDFDRLVLLAAFAYLIALWYRLSLAPAREGWRRTTA